MPGPGKTSFQLGLDAHLAEVARLAHGEVVRLQLLLAEAEAENVRLARLLDSAGAEHSLGVSGAASTVGAKRVCRHCVDAAEHLSGDLPAVAGRISRDQVSSEEPGLIEKSKCVALAAMGTEAHCEEFENELSCTCNSPSLDRESGEPDARQREPVQTNLFNSARARLYYRHEGIAQYIARAPWFEHLTLFVIVLNAVWISIDLDFNNESSPLNADLIFVLMDNLFCFYFTAELAIRFCAYQTTLSCLNDKWFVFDAIMVMFIIFDVWILKFALLVFGVDALQHMGNMSMFRMLRLIRLTRIGKMMRFFPEAMIIVKGLKTSLRSVSITVAMLAIVTYIFAIVFRQLSAGTDIGAEFYSSVPEAMKTLLLEGVMPDNASMITGFLDEAWYLAILFAAFIFVCALTFLNMLVGFLCDIVSTTSNDEKEAASIAQMRDRLQSALEDIDTNHDGQVSKSEVVQVLYNDRALEALHQVGVDVPLLVQEVDLLFDETSMSFDDFVQILLQFRYSSYATLGAVAVLRRSVRCGHAKTDSHVERLHRALERLRSDLLARTEVVI